MATALQKLLAVAAEGDPLELPFVAALAQLHYAQPDAPPPPAGKARRARHRSLPPAWAAYERPTDALVARPAEPSQRATVDGHIAWLRGFSGKLGEFRSV